MYGDRVNSEGMVSDSVNSDRLNRDMIGAGVNSDSYHS